MNQQVTDHTDDDSDEFQLAVGDTVEVPVKFTLKKGSVHKLFSFTVFADRLDQETIDERLATKDQKATVFMREVMTGWKDQALVLRADGTPAAYSEKARDAMLSAPGVGVLIFNAYLVECGAKVKN